MTVLNLELGILKLNFASREHTLPLVFELLTAELFVIIYKENEGRERLLTVPQCFRANEVNYG